MSIIEQQSKNSNSTPSIIIHNNNVIGLPIDPGHASISPQIPSKDPEFASPIHPYKAPQSSTAKGRYGEDTDCETLDPTGSMETILKIFGDQALLEGQRAIVDMPLSLRRSVGGEFIDQLPSNTRVRIICTAQKDFALVKVERGNFDGVVDKQYLKLVGNE